MTNLWLVLAHGMGSEVVEAHVCMTCGMSHGKDMISQDNNFYFYFFKSEQA